MSIGRGLGILVALAAWSSEATAEERPVVAVFGVENKGAAFAPEMLDRMSEYLSTRIAESGRYQIVPREQLKSALRTQKVESYKACYDEACQLDIGKELAANKSLASSISKFGKKCIVTVRLFDLRKGTGEAAGSAQGACDEGAVVGSIDGAVEKLLGLVAGRAAPPELGRTDYGDLEADARRAEAKVAEDQLAKKARAEKAIAEWKRISGYVANRAIAADKRAEVLKKFLAANPADNPHAPEAERALASLDAPADLALIPAGSFDMGSPVAEEGRDADELLHRVTITRPFFMMRTEVTQSDWSASMGGNPSAGTACGPSCPVEKVSWWDALVYANRRSMRESFEECYELSECSGTVGDTFTCKGVTFLGLDCTGYRLPTEAEWEYAARAGTKGPYYAARLDDIAWYEDNSAAATHPVKRKAANPFGLYDALGNVWEWCWDFIGEYPSRAVTDPLGPSAAESRVLRGGAFYVPAARARAAYRDSVDPNTRADRFGFRLVRTAR